MEMWRMLASSLLMTAFCLKYPTYIKRQKMEASKDGAKTDHNVKTFKNTDFTDAPSLTFKQRDVG